jgi:hypothetical protein
MKKKIIIIACGILLTIGCKQEEERRLSVLQKENMEIKGILPSVWRFQRTPDRRSPGSLLSI